MPELIELTDDQIEAVLGHKKPTIFLFWNKKQSHDPKVLKVFKDMASKMKEAGENLMVVVSDV